MVAKVPIVSAIDVSFRVLFLAQVKAAGVIGKRKIIQVIENQRVYGGREHLCFVMNAWRISLSELT